jgi:anti-anti-sigma factor
MEFTVSVADTQARRSVPCAPREPAHFTSCLISASTVMVAAEGEVDAWNAGDLAEYVERSLEASTRLIVDLRDLQFFGTQGFSTLHKINVTCSGSGVNWVVIPGREVDRLLRICDPGGGLPVATTLETAVAAVVRGPRSHLRMIPRS